MAFTVLTNLGEKMSDDEVDELLKAVDTSSGEINYTGMYSTELWTRIHPAYPLQALVKANLLIL